jgi:FtsH-binding integral membrane protein
VFPSYAASSNAETSESGLFGEVMWLVAAALGFLTLGAYLGRDFSGGASIVCWLIGFVCIVGLNFARNAGGAAVGLLLAAGTFLGLALGGTLDFYASASPGAVWQSAAATALSVTALGSIGYTTESDLSWGYRVLFFLLVGLIGFGFVSLFVSMPAGNVIYAVLGLVIFSGYTVLDFNRMRRADNADAVSIAAGIFLDVLNIFLFFLQLFGRGRD